MTITVHPNSATPPTQCLASSATQVRRVGRPFWSWGAFPAGVNNVPSCQERLAEAQAKLHQVELNGPVQYIHHEGRTLTFGPHNIEKLRQYVRLLESQCGTAASVGSGACGCGGHNTDRLGRARVVI